MSKRTQQPRKTLVESARKTVAASAGLAIRMAERRVTGFLEARMAPTGLNVARFGLMAQIAAARDERIGALAARSGLDRAQYADLTFWLSTVEPEPGQHRFSGRSYY